MSQPITLNRYVCFLVTLFFIWFFPGYYLLTHEAGHCLSAKQLGSHQQQLYLACSGEKKPLYTLQPANSMTIFICKPYFYRFFMQEGGCSYSWEQQGSPSSQKIQRTWFLVAGSIYGLVASYLLRTLWIPLLSAPLQTCSSKMARHKKNSLLSLSTLSLDSKLTC